MVEERAKRKLTAILSADIKGYSRLMGDDELSTVETLKSYREIISTLVQQFSGRVVDSPGDNVLAEFSSVVDAVECAVKIQGDLREKNASLPDNRRMEFRIGINLGDVIDDEGRIYGDGVNVAARVEGLAEGGGICISRTAFDQVKNKVNLGYENLGEHSVKNIAEPVRVYEVLMAPEHAGKVIGEKIAIPKQWRWAAAAIGVIIVVGILVIWNFYFRPPQIEPASVEKMAYPLPEKPSIAVLPFVNMTNDANQEFIADGITENIITALSKVPEIFVIARNSVFTYKGKPVKIKQVSEELGVQYVLEGSIQKSESHLRITAQLIDATAGHHIWAERFDRNVKDIFALQDEVTLNILSALRVEFTHGEQERVQKATKSLEAWSFFVKGLSHFESFTKDDNTRAQELFERAVRVDPEYSYAWAMLGWTHWIDAAYGFSEPNSNSFEKAIKIAQKALELNDKLPDVHTLLGGIHLFQRQYDKAVAEGQRAIALAPNIACNKALLSRTMLFAGRFEEAIKLVKSAMRLSPHYPSWYLESLAMAYGVIGEHEKAVASYEKLLDLRRNARGNIITPLLGLAASCIILGREDEARAYAEEVLGVSPDFSLEWFRKVNLFKNPSHLKPFLEALHKAGLPETPPLQLPDKPSIAVLPFINMSGDPEQEYFSDGITEEIITALSKTPKLFVIARTSSFKYKGKDLDLRTIGRELGVRYVLEGSVRKSGHKARITAQLIDAKTNQHLWAERYNRDLEDIFVLQDEITMKILSALQVKLTEGEQASVYEKGTNNLDAYLKVLEGSEHSNRFNRQANALARKIYEEATALDPGYAMAYLRLSATHIMDIHYGSSPSPEQSLNKAEELVRKALALDGTLGEAHAFLGRIYLAKRQYDEAIREGEHALTLAPNSAFVYAALAFSLRFAGRPEEAIPLFKKAIRLNPLPDSWYLTGLGGCYRVVGRYTEAISVFKQALNLSPNSAFTHAGQAANYSLLGRDEEARAEAAEVLRINPKFSLEYFAKTFPYKNQTDRERLVEACRKAGLK